MTKQTEAMKLALEALVHLQPTALTSFYTIGDRDKAITALREALAEQPAQQCRTEPRRLHQSEREGWRYADELEQERKRLNEANQAMLEALKAQPAQQEPVALKWQQAPVKTQWGDDMVVASIAIDKDHTVCLYCERDQTPKVDAMFAQRTWVGLSELNIYELENNFMKSAQTAHEFLRVIEAKLKEKNR
jgi:tetratricopeptide (TPR) repeat protein